MLMTSERAKILPEAEPSCPWPGHPESWLPPLGLVPAPEKCCTTCTKSNSLLHCCHQNTTADVYFGWANASFSFTLQRQAGRHVIEGQTSSGKGANLEDISFSAANCRRAAVGSEPADSTKMRGVTGVESAWHACRSKVGGSTNLRPSCASTKSCTAGTTLSGLQDWTGHQSATRHQQGSSPEPPQAVWCARWERRSVSFSIACYM